MGEEWWSPDASGDKNAAGFEDDGSWWGAGDSAGAPTTIVDAAEPSTGPPSGPVDPVLSAPPDASEERRRRLRLRGLDRGLVVAVALLVIALLGLVLAVRNAVADHTVYDPTRLQMASGLSEVNASGDARVGMVDLPDVRRLSRDRALEVLSEAGVPEQNVVVDPIDRAGPPNVVVEQDPPHGTNDPEQVTLRVSRQVQMPDYIGRAETDVVKQLRTYGATVDVSSRFQAGAVPGAVLEQSVPAGEPMPESLQLVVAGEGERVPLDRVESPQRDCYSGGDANVNGALLPESTSCSLSTSYLADEPSTNVYVLSREFDSFLTTLGVSDDSGASLPVRFRILADQRVVVDTTLSLGQSQDVTVPTTGVLQLQLEASYVGAETTGYSNLEGVFGSPTLVTSPDVAAKYLGN